jgi:CHASE1-domain containing sensor protein
MRGRGYLAFFVGICLTAWTCYFVLEEQQKQQVRAGFQRDAEKVARDTQNRMQIYFDTLHGMKGVYAVNDRIDRQHFHRFVTELKIERRYPGFQALQFVRPVPEAELPAFVERVKRDTSVDAGGYPNFHVHPASAAAALHHRIHRAAEGQRERLRPGPVGAAAAPEGAGTGAR